MRISETIKARRKELNLTQEQVADCLGVTAPAVHKWEKGVSFPDVSLLPALARLLNMDMNTLFSFEKELTEQEINLFSNEVIGIIQKEGYQAGYDLVMQKVWQFPGCAPLLYTMGALLEGALTLFGEENREKYEERIAYMYERAAELGEGSVRDNANYMLILKYIREKEYKKAEEMLERLPDAPVMPMEKQMLKATLFINQDRPQEAIHILEERIWNAANAINTTLGTLMNCFWKIGDEERAQFTVQKMKETVEVFGLWDYGTYLADYEAAVHDKKKEKALLSLRHMLDAMGNPWKIADFPLYADIFQKNGESEGRKLIRSSMIESIRKENGLDGEGFLKGDADLERLLEEFDRQKS